MEQAITISQILENVTLSIALVIGGIWTILRYRRLREEKRSMESEARIQVSNQYVNDMALVTLVFLMKMQGHAR